MTYVFLSYARPDAAKAKRIASGLEAAGYEVWWDEQLPTHRTFYEVIEERLRTAQAVVVLWSKAAVASQWVRAEADLARTLGKLVQASADNELPPIPFNQFQCAHLKGWAGKPDHPEWMKVLDGVRAVSGGRRRAVKSAGTASATSVPAAHRLRRIMIAASAGVVIALAAVAGWFATHRSSPQQEGSRIAVLPFDADPGDRLASAFAATLAEGLAGSLSENQVQVVRLSRSAKFAGNRRDDALRKLDASLALGGSVRTLDSRLVVRAYLQDVGSGATVWSAQFERPVDQQAKLLGEASTAVTETAFNVADSAITVGATCLILDELLRVRRTR